MDYIGKTVLLVMAFFWFAMVSMAATAVWLIEPAHADSPGSARTMPGLAIPSGQ